MTASTPSAWTAFLCPNGSFFGWGMRSSAVPKCFTTRPGSWMADLRYLAISGGVVGLSVGCANARQFATDSLCTFVTRPAGLSSGAGSP
eukprot:5383916-Pyramimonas_sp.AAC.1